MKTQHSIGRVLVLALGLTRFGALAQAQNTNNQELWVAPRLALPRQLPSGSGTSCPAPAALAPAVVDFEPMADAIDLMLSTRLR